MVDINPSFVQVNNVMSFISFTRKGGMQKWLKDKKNPFDGKMKKTELYEIIKLKKSEPVYKTDEFLRGKGYDALRLPHTIMNLTLLKCIQIRFTPVQVKINNDDTLLHI
jgi:hypothetical protein